MIKTIINNDYCFEEYFDGIAAFALKYHPIEIFKLENRQLKVKKQVKEELLIDDGEEYKALILSAFRNINWYEQYEIIEHDIRYLVLFGTDNYAYYSFKIRIGNCVQSIKDSRGNVFYNIILNEFDEILARYKNVEEHYDKIINALEKLQWRIKERIELHTEKPKLRKKGQDFDF